VAIQLGKRHACYSDRRHNGGVVVFSDLELITHIRELLTLQEKLAEAFRDKHPNLHDWEWLLDFPKSGELQLDEERYEFRKHGAGLRFTDSIGRVVDMHCWLTNPGVFDAYRLLQYLESVVPSNVSILMTERDLEVRLENLRRSGQIRQAETRGFHFNYPREGPSNPGHGSGF